MTLTDYELDTGDTSMERAANEIAAVEKTVAEIARLGLSELNDLQLALVGGGAAEVFVG